MNQTIQYRLSSRSLFAAVVLSLAAPFAEAQLTNWVAYNDHRPTTAPVANGWRITAPNVTGYDMGAPADLPPSALTNFLTGNALSATVSFTRTNAPDDFGTVGRPLLTNTPMAGIFYGICDLSNDGLVGVDESDGAYVTITFGGLDPSKRYVFRGSVARNGGYGTRWSVAAISTESWTDAHINGAGGPGVLTANTFPASGLGPAEAAWNSGANNEGAVIGWNDIAPYSDGTFSITCKQYTGEIPGGTANADYGYSFGAIMLAEVEVVAPTITGHPVAQTTVEENRTFSLNVAATGAPLFYQWYKEGAGEIGGATFSTYSVAQAQLSDSGAYYAVVFNGLARQTSSVAQVTVTPDTNAPAVEIVFPYPTVDITGVATLDQIIIEFNEAVASASVSSPDSYNVSGGIGTPLSVVVTNERSVVLLLGAPLAEDTDYTVTLDGAMDLVGNVAGASMASFHSWTPGFGNGLIMESYPAEDPSLFPESLLTDPDYPDNPDRRDLLRAFDTRLVYPDDVRQGYGARIRGVFIPPVSGQWRFFARTPNLAVLYLNPNGIAEAGKVEVLRQSTQNAPYNWDRLQSSLVTLRAGRPYYIEGLYKAVSGANYFKVAARLAGTDVPMPVDTPDTEVDPNSLTGAAIGFPLAPRDLGGSLTIVQQPADTTAEETHTATFSVEVGNASGLPVFYQWFKDGIEIPGANAASYSFEPTSADGGAVFSVRAAKLGSSVVSETATLAVTPDVTPPMVVDVRGSYQLDRVIISFSERVEPLAAEDSISYTISPFSVVSAVLDATGTNVVLTLDGTLTPGSTYPMLIFAQDLSFNGEESMATLQAWVLSRGFALQQLYLDIGPGTMVADLTGHAKYPDSPDQVSWVPSLEGPIDQSDNYGTRLTGWIVPSATENYIFYMSSDDAGEFRFSLDENLANGGMIAQETSYNGSRMWTGDREGGTRGDPPSNISLPIPLSEGLFYAFEALAKEGTGNDNLAVTWSIEGGPVPTNGAPPISGSHLYALADPVGASVEITEQPASLSIQAGETASFSITASGTMASGAAPIAYQWQRSVAGVFTDIAGGNSASFTTGILNESDDGAQYRALVFIPGASATSSVATVTVGGGGGQPSIAVSTTGDGAIALSWEAGFRLQCTTSLTPPINWQDVDTGGANSYTINPANQFDVNLDTAQSGGGARTGSGNGTVTLSGNTLLVDVTYSGLSSDRNNSHFHAPAPRGESAGVAYGTQAIATGTRDGTVQGTITLADGAYDGKEIAAQLQDLRNSLWYLNIHTVDFGSGEIRGQVEPARARFYRVVNE